MGAEMILLYLLQSSSSEGDVFETCKDIFSMYVHLKKPKECT